MKINISIPTKLGGKEAAKEIRNEVAGKPFDITTDKKFKWLPEKVEKRLGLKRTRFCIGQSFLRCCVVYQTSIPGVFLTNYDDAGQLVDTHTWMVFGENEGVRITDDFLKDIHPGLFTAEFLSIIPKQSMIEQ